MPRRPTPALAATLWAACAELRDPRLWMPAAVLLLPTLVLQLAFPHWLRTRLSPSLWTVIAGSLCLVLITQMAAAASWGWVHAIRRGSAWRGRALARAATQVGALTTLGLMAGVLPAFWLQARLAHVPMQAVDAQVPAASAGDRWRLTGLAALTLLLSTLGQSLAAGLAEALGTIVPAAVVDGRVQFHLNQAPHIVTSVIAYAWTVLALTLQAIAVSLALGDARRLEPTPSLHVARPRAFSRLAVTGVALVLVMGVIAAVHKVQQHLY